MPIHTLGQPEGAIHHTGIGPNTLAAAPVEVAMNGAPAMAKRGGNGRRWFLGLALGMAGAMSPGLGMAQAAPAKPANGASASEDPMNRLREVIVTKLLAAKAPEAPSPYVVRVVNKAGDRSAVKVAQPNVKGDNMTEAQMDKLDNNIKLIDDVDGGKETLIAEHTLGMEMPVERIKQYIDEILERAERTKHGVHMQEHENAMWIIDYFNQTKTTDSRVLYYPSKVGDDSPFVQAFKKANKGKPGYEERKVNVPTKEGFKEITVYMNERTDKLRTLPKERAVRAAVDVGTAYVILPKGAQIIERTETISGKEVKKYLIADCGNEIFQALSECPPAGKASTK